MLSIATAYCKKPRIGAGGGRKSLLFCGLVNGRSRTLQSSTGGSIAGVVLAPVSIGELIDKIVILEIKAARLTDPHKLKEVSKELSLLNQIDYGAAECRDEIKTLKEELRQVNASLWDIEDRIRNCEREQDFGPGFVELARAVYKTNDRRSTLKRRINEMSGSPIVEIKAHPAY